MIINGDDIDPLKKKSEDLKEFSQRINDYAHYYKNDINYI